MSAARLVDTHIPTNRRRRRVNLWGVATLAILAASGALMIGACMWTWDRASALAGARPDDKLSPGAPTAAPLAVPEARL